ncbi:MAG: MoaD/ThiS family protein [Thermodesulfobacteriota bacterium]
MRIQILLTAHLKRYSPGQEEALEWEVAPEATVADIVGRLGIPPEVIYVVVQNGRRVDLPARLQDGDQLLFLAPITGG